MNEITESKKSDGESLIINNSDEMGISLEKLKEVLGRLIV